MILGRAPALELCLPGVTRAVSSNQAPLRHTGLTTYRCFLPDLTGFMASRCAGPGSHSHLQGPDPKRQTLKQASTPL